MISQGISGTTGVVPTTRPRLEERGGYGGGGGTCRNPKTGRPNLLFDSIPSFQRVTEGTFNHSIQLNAGGFTLQVKVRDLGYSH